MVGPRGAKKTLLHFLQKYTAFVNLLYVFVMFLVNQGKLLSSFWELGDERQPLQSLIFTDKTL